MSNDKARMILLTGNGKGKTTSALGMALRAWGHGMPVKIIQFIKSDTDTGEYVACMKLDGIEIVQYGCGFVPKPASSEFLKHCDAAEDGLAAVVAVLSEMDDGLLVLDEICGAVSKGLLDADRVMQVLDQASAGLCLVLTGRGAPDSFIERADTVTELNCVKHGFQSGISAQPGAEY